MPNRKAEDHPGQEHVLDTENGGPGGVSSAMAPARAF